MPKHFTLAGGLCLLLAAFPAAGQPLQQILRQSLANDPTVREAEANERAAQSAVSASKAGHYPVVSLTGTQVLAQKHRNDRNERSKGLNPGLTANLNLYAWGGIEAEVEQNRYKAEYFGHKIDETREQLGSEIGKLYLGALRAKELIEAGQNNLQRHGRIVADLRIIAKHDKGRQSELDQALDRQLRAESYVIEQQHQLESYLSRLGKYTGNMMASDQLQDPFERDTPESLVARYRNPDLVNLPSYQAQEAERKSVAAEVKVVRASRFPRVNLIANADKDDKEAYINFSWDFFNPAAKYQQERTSHTLAAAETRMDQILRDVAERSRNAQIDMQQYLRRHEIAQRQIASQKKVVKNYELQFKIARRTLIDLLNSYGDLSNIELSAIASRNNFRDAALEYLVSQAAVGQWAALSNGGDVLKQSGNGVLTSQKVSRTPSAATAADTVGQPEKTVAAQPAANNDKRNHIAAAESTPVAVKQPEQVTVATAGSSRTNLTTQTAGQVKTGRQPEKVQPQPSQSAVVETAENADAFFAQLQSKQLVIVPIESAEHKSVKKTVADNPVKQDFRQPERSQANNVQSIDKQAADQFFKQLERKAVKTHSASTVADKKTADIKQPVAVEPKQPQSDSAVFRQPEIVLTPVSASEQEIVLQPVSTGKAIDIDADAELLGLPDTPSPESE